jgi:cytoskeletal protein CcmA (bactofilin family)
LRPPPLPAIPTLDTPVSPTPARDPAASTAAPAETAGSTLSVGPNIELKGAEISDCAILVVEGRMEATVNSTVMQIAQTGTLKGLALIDVAEIHGEFSGELTAHKKLVVHGTGRVTGIIRYGKLVVVEGGELTGDVKRLETSMAPGQPAPVRMADSSAKSTPTLTD